jgi:hypothetical protein
MPPKKKMEDKVVFMQCAGTMNVIKNQHQKKLMSQSAERIFNLSPYASQINNNTLYLQKLPTLTK